MDRPRIVMLNEASLDGRIAVAPGKLLLYGDERWTAMVPPSDFDVFGWLRQVHKPGATLEGSGSFARPDERPGPLPAVEGDSAPLYEDYVPESILNRPGHRGWFAAVDGRGRIRWVYKEYPDEAWKGWWPLVLAGTHTPPEYLAYLRREEVPYLVAGGGPVDLAGALAKMRALLGVDCLLVTGGGGLKGALLRAGLVDEVNVILYPALTGGTHTPTLFDAPDLRDGEQPLKLRLLSAQVQSGGSVWLRYEVARG